MKGFGGFPFNLYTSTFDHVNLIVAEQLIQLTSITILKVIFIGLTIAITIQYCTVLREIFK